MNSFWLVCLIKVLNEVFVIRYYGPAIDLYLLTFAIQKQKHDRRKSHTPS